MNKWSHSLSLRGNILSTVSLIALMVVSSPVDAQDDVSPKSTVPSQTGKEKIRKRKKNATPVSSMRQPEGTTEVPPVSVNAPAAPLMDGSAEAGYRVKESSAAGPIWGNLPLQDAPYSITVLPNALIQNTQAYKPEDIYKLLPQASNTQSSQNQDGAFSNPTVRGFGTGTSVDGLQGANSTPYGGANMALEDKESVQLLSGVNGFLYGNSTNLGGNIDYTMKRPTAAPLYTVTFGNNAGANWYVHGDFGGPINIAGLDPGVLGYRLNLAGQDGHTSIYNQTVKRLLLSGAFDIHLPGDILLQPYASHNYYKTNGLTRIVYTSLNPWPAPADPSNLSSPNWTEVATTTDTGGVKATWKANEIFTVRSEYQFNRSRYFYSAYTISSLQDYSGTLNVNSGGSGGAGTNIAYTHSGYAFLDADFATFGIKHKLTTGFSGNVVSQYSVYSAMTGIGGNLGTANFYTNSVAYFASPGYTYSCCGAGYVTSQTFQKNYFLGDQITALDDRLIILVGGNYTELGSNTFANGSTTPGYGVARLTPTASVVYKITPLISAYATYQQAVQNGQIVTSTAYRKYTNNGEILPPYLGEQYEAGVKATVGTNLLLGLAYFHITTGHIYAVNNNDGTYTLTKSGNETHQGVELTATGRLTNDWTLFGGLTAMDARVKGAIATPWQNGQIPANVSPVSAKLYTEYTIPLMAGLPDWLHGLTLIGGFYYTGPFNGSTPSSYANISKIIKLPSYATCDLGFRYDTMLDVHPFTLRFNVTNLTNHAYYTGSAMLEGPPRTYMATATIQW